MAVILRSCPKLRFLKVEDFYAEVERPMTSITLQDLVEVPWACTHLDHLELAVADARDFSTVGVNENEENNGEDDDEGRKETARLQLVCIYRMGSRSGASLGESSLALLWRNNGLRDLELDFYDSHVRCHVLPSLPHLTNLQSLKIRLSDALMTDYDLLLDVLQTLPPSVQELALENVSSEVLTTPPRTWKPSAIRRFTMYPTTYGRARHFLIPFLRSCPQLERLSLPTTSGSCADALMDTIASSCPQLSSLELNSQRLTRRPFGTECVHFSHLHQQLSVLSLDICNDRKNVVVPTILAHSTSTIRELWLFNAVWLRSLDVAMILRSCSVLRVLRVEDVPSSGGRSKTSITLQDLVDVPWASTRLYLLDLAVTDGRDSCVLEERDDDGGQVETARLLLQLHRQIQEQGNFQRQCSFQFCGQKFKAMPLEAELGHLGGHMSAHDLLRLGLEWNA
ncbi:hypothetical protein BGZ70_007798 [Mortierella alpina]|uniref:Uncharacterized protein n=1 Tax=Mortierella alpina TaxID=64518 RepID=A0A9P6J5D0_MORAP|nr:hypothetical protein BGZ70_007798 [Mortierella alpina]